jgi:hypothetical protein
VRHDGFAAHTLKVIHLYDVPALHLRIDSGALFVMFGAFASRLIFGRDPNPNANRL